MPEISEKISNFSNEQNPSEARSSGGEVIVVDALMGRGKSSWARQEMRAHPERHWLYVTPYLNEINNIIVSCPECYFRQPDTRGHTKLESLNELLELGENIATTHVNFAMIAPRTIELIREGQYVLILDEVLDVLLDFNSATNDSINSKDVSLILENKFVSVDKDGKVNWISKSYLGSKFSNIERTARLGNLYLIRGKMLLWAFPPQIFAAFEKCYILTYCFEGSQLRPYFECFGIGYKLAGIEKDSNGKYLLGDYKNDIAIRGTIKELIDIYSNPAANHFERTSLSSTDFSRMLNKADGPERQRLNRLKNGLHNFIRNVCKTDGADVMWTAPKKARDALKGKGYTGRDLTPEEKELPLEQQNEILGQKTCFIPLNARAANEYRHKHCLAYLANIYVKPTLKAFFDEVNKAHGTHIAINEEAMALSFPLQWIWRSAIRENQRIRIWIPSTRMRNLLTAWLEGRI